MDTSEPTTVKIDIFNNQYLIKPPDNLSEDDIRTLAHHVDQLMRQVNRKGYDQLSVAILVALNIAEQMYKERKHASEVIQRLIQNLDNALGPEDSPPGSKASD